MKTRHCASRYSLLVLALVWAVCSLATGQDQIPQDPKNRITVGPHVISGHNTWVTYDPSSESIMVTIQKTAESPPLTYKEIKVSAFDETGRELSVEKDSPAEIMSETHSLAAYASGDYKLISRGSAHLAKIRVSREGGEATFVITRQASPSSGK